jgi:GlpG protein
MHETNPDAPQAMASLLPSVQKQPWLTWLSCAACMLVFIGIHAESGGGESDAVMKWGWQPPDRIYDGVYWALFTSVFVHVEFWHLGFNLYWLYHLGRRLEQAIGSWRWLAFFLGAALVSSSAELAVGGNTGIGASGVGYALFGLMWILRKHVPAFAEILDQRAVAIFLIWLVACVAMTAANVLAVGNAAHFSGLLFGTAVAASILHKTRRQLVAIAIALLVGASVASLIWAPWSMSWTSWRAVRSHKNGDYTAAIRWYERSMNQGQDKKWCQENIELARQAMEYEHLRHPVKAR